MRWATLLLLWPLTAGAAEYLTVDDLTKSFLAELVPCSGASNAVTYNATTKTFGCNSIGGGPGGSNTASNLGGGLANYDSAVGTDLRFNTFWSADFDLAANLIKIDDTKWATDVDNQLVDSAEASNDYDIKWNATQNVWFINKPGAGDDTESAAEVLTAPGGSDPVWASNMELYVFDVDQDGDIEGDDVQDIIDACGQNTTGGCTVIMPRGDIELDANPGLDFGKATGIAAGITLRGQGMCALSTTPSQGTRLIYDTANTDGGTAIRVASSSGVHLSDFCILMDEDGAAASGNEAGVGILVQAKGDAPIYSNQFFTVDRVGIYGAYDGNPPPATMIGMKITSATVGPPISGENDKLTFRDVFIQNVSTGILNDALQSIVNHWYGGQISYYVAGYKSVGGWIDFLNTLFAPLVGNTYAFDMGVQTNGSAGKHVLSNIYFETSAVDDAHFLKVGDGFDDAPPGGTNTNILHPIIVENGYFIQQCDATAGEGSCSSNLVDASSGGGIIFRNNQIVCTEYGGNCGYWNVKVSNPDGQRRGLVSFDDNVFTSWISHPNLVQPTFNPGTTGGAPNLIIQNYTTTPEGILYNDLDFDGSKDAGEVDFLNQSSITVGAGNPPGTCTQYDYYGQTAATIRNCLCVATDTWQCSTATAP